MPADGNHASWYRPHAVNLLGDRGKKGARKCEGSIERAAQIINEILDRRFGDEGPLSDLLAQLLIEGHLLGRRSIRPHITAERKAAAVAEYQAGRASVAELASRYEVGKSTVYDWVKGAS